MLQAWARHKLKKVKRLPMELAIRNIVEWKPLENPCDGYSIAIACMCSLTPLAIANIRLLARQNRRNLREVFLVFDRPEGEIPQLVRDAIEEFGDKTTFTLVGYSPAQSQCARSINWGWVYAWISWCLAIARTRTKALIIHDLDAMPLDPDFFETLYENWAAEGAPFCGIRRYRGNGVTEEMGLVTTFELTLDPAYLRSRFRPYDLFNKLKLVNGALVDFDTMLYAQSESPKRALRPVDETGLVHPSQLICGYTDLVAGRTDFRGREHMLLMLPYFAYLGNDPSLLNEVRPGLSQEAAKSVRFGGKELAIDGLSAGSWAWMEKQIRRLEQGIFEHTRPEVESYLEGFVRRAGERRTVGKESGPLAVPDR